MTDSLALSCWRQAAEHAGKGDYREALLRANHALWLVSLEAGLLRADVDRARLELNEAVGAKGSAA